MRRALVAVLLAACEPAIPDSRPADIAYAFGDRDGLGTLYGAACHRLRVLGCPEGFITRTGQTCFERLTTLSKSTDVSAHCIKSSPHVTSLRECGWHQTLRIRCVMPSVDEVGSSLP